MSAYSQRFFTFYSLVLTACLLLSAWCSVPISGNLFLGLTCGAAIYASLFALAFEFVDVYIRQGGE